MHTSPITGRPCTIKQVVLHRSEALGNPEVQAAKTGQGDSGPLLEVAAFPPAFACGSSVLTRSPIKPDGTGQGPSLPPKERVLWGEGTPS